MKKLGATLEVIIAYKNYKPKNNIQFNPKKI